MPDKMYLDVAIRPWSDGDLGLLERLVGDPTMTEHIGGPETPDQIRKRHARYCQSNKPGAGPMFVIVLGSEKTVTGSIGYWQRRWQNQSVWETGWSVLPEFQGLGIATRAAMQVVGYARLERRHRFMHAFPSVDNAPSNAICRKAGFKLQEQINFEYPPGNFLNCNDWCLDLFADVSAAAFSLVDQ
jgi:RimJ/RimL family protein N-acetyltransferase